ncbi:hypothetical protein [Caballeronia novacaledonica]|uniref:Uncharacterized protein n=1 Tax=Caballeronia novacaledonica TaxID=1544861 RepID=A0AA37MV12_9BURK|nr:hypothetical protein [Caballeronia novacaledonica]GJH29954.1 hypothetical protein CBA19CS42_35580 [Caballeronia novacaledonica]
MSIAPVLWETVDNMLLSLEAHIEQSWAQLASAHLSRCVFEFACLARERRGVDCYPEATCAMVFHQSASRLMLDASAKEWNVPVVMMPVVTGILIACGELVVARVAHPD